MRLFNNIILPDYATVKDGKTHNKSTHEITGFTTQSSNPSSVQHNSMALRKTSNASVVSIAASLGGNLDDNAPMDWKLCFQDFEDYADFTIFMNSSSVLKVTQDFRFIGFIMLLLVSLRLLSLAVLIFSNDREDFTDEILTLATVLLVISVAQIVLISGLYIWNRVTNVSQMLIDEGIFIIAVLFVNIFAVISSLIQLEFANMNELVSYSSNVNSYYNNIKPGEEMTLSHELLLYCMLVPVIAHASGATVRWTFVLLSIPFVLGVAIATFVTLDAQQSFSLIAAFCVLDIYLLAAQRVERVRLFNSSRKIQEVASTSKETASHLQSQEKEAVNLRHIVANTAHDLKTPVVAMVHGCEILHGNVIEISKACSSIEDKIQPMEVTMKEHILRRTAYIEEEMKAALDTLDDIKNTSNFMLLTINRFLDYTKVAHGFKLVPKLDTFNLFEALHLSIHCIGKTVIHDKVELCPIPPNICKFVVTDKQWFQENIICLVSNALKFSPGGGIKIRVGLKYPPPVVTASAPNSAHDSGNRILNKVSEISLRWGVGNTPREKKVENSDHGTKEADYEGYKVVVEVSDCGIGISKDMQRQLFEPFRQAQRLAGGTGLGLFSLSKRLDSLQGEYGVKDRDDGKQGSVFWFAFPYRPDEMFAQAIESTSEKALSTKSVKEYIDRRIEKDKGFGSAAISEKSVESERTAEVSIYNTEATKKLAGLIPSSINTTEAIMEESSSKSSGVFSPRSIAKQKSKQTLSILIVDDSPTIVKMTTKLLL